MLRIGLTGGIGSGKSTVADLFAQLDTPVVDTDIIARAVVAPGEPALQEIVAQFGANMRQADGTLDRAALRSCIFADATRRRQLEAILHPRIQATMEARINTLDAPYCLVVIPLLFETGQQTLVDRVLVIDAPEATRIERVMARDGIPARDVQATMAAQWPGARRLAMADDVIANTADPQALVSQVQELHEQYLRLAASWPP